MIPNEPEWVPFNGYYFSRKFKTWVNAASLCEEWGFNIEEFTPDEFLELIELDDFRRTIKLAVKKREKTCRS